MRVKRMLIFAAGLFSVGIFCLNSAAFGDMGLC